MAAKKQSSEPPSLITSLPQDIILDILARVSRFDYPAFSVVCKHFRSIIASPEIYARRSLLGRTEHCLYVFLSCMDETRWRYCNRCYILCPKAEADGERRLVLIPSLPPIPTYSEYATMGFVAVGSRIYAFGRSSEHRMITLSIDCVSHTVQRLPSMPVIVSNTMADIIDGRIYVIGYGNHNDWKMKMEVFNTEIQTWEPGMMMSLDKDARYIYNNSCVAMADKIYTKNSINSFVYDPKENKWETDEMLDLKIWHNACIVDDVLYYLDCYGGELRAYDRKKRYWQVVKGLEALLSETASVRQRSEDWSPQTFSYDGKLALFFPREDSCHKKIWCAEISLERRQGGEIWGKVDWRGGLLTGKFLSLKALDVVV
ncbi:F-box/kelch-repeat protein At4g38940-like [Raphanus sativus]|uniref:F-box/kelch-repeat protein At4g38940-like n=1 Tax=Raphanus sativus TaxID=3726 RepID=A0A6J0LUZ0_RAPSA|nr:F-box/kelch-repeat protein At4g38940-like [Raphanus sativus]